MGEAKTLGIDLDGREEERDTWFMMTKTELAQTLGIVNDPDENKVSLKTTSSKALFHAISALKLQEQQKREYGSLNPDLWLELVPWHSLN